MKTRQTSPLSSSYDESNDVKLLQLAIEGNRKALNELLETHNQFIFNIALKMLADVERAKDITQDILVKITTNLSKYDPNKAPFRAWLYRLAFNHILDEKKSPTENRIKSYSQFFGLIEEIPDEEVEEYADEDHPYNRETKIKCTAGMLMCLSREQRLLFVVGELFQVNHALGAEIFGISKANFRKKLSRIRKELYEWMHNRCGLINKNNACRCNKKTKGFIERGIVDPNDLLWNKSFKHRIEDFTQSKLEEIQVSSDKVYAKLYREHPMKEPLTTDEVMSAVLGDKNLKDILDI